MDAVQHAHRLGIVNEPYRLGTAADVELKFAMRMRREGIMRATIVINHVPCKGRFGCTELLPEFLPPGAQLTVHGADGFSAIYQGRDEPQ